MKMKWMIVAVVVALLATGCGDTITTEEMDDVATNEGYLDTNEAGTALEAGATETLAGTPIIKKEDLKIGVIYIGSASETSGYTFTHELGVAGMVDNLGLDSSQVVRFENVDDSDTEAIDVALKACIEEGCNVVFATSWGYMEQTAEYAQKYPDIYFAHGTGYQSNGTNLTNYFGRIYQARYLSGIVAGMKTKTNKIGYVAAMGPDSAEVTGGIDAFALGVESVNPQAKILVSITYSWFDPEGERAAAEQLLDAGCDILAQHCDTTAPQEAAQERGRWAVGYNSDMSKETPDATLTSVIWTWSAYYTSYVQSIMDGSYDGSNYYEGMSVGLLGLSGIADFSEEGTEEKVSEAQQQILQGQFDVFEGEMLTNDGQTIGKTGEKLDDATITGGINWYYHNVEVLE